MAIGYLKIIYSGSFINAQFIGTVLEDNNIKYVIRDDFQNSIVAGWVTPGAENSVKVLVAKEDLSKALKAISEAKDNIK